jgi:hypothetical protein
VSRTSPTPQLRATLDAAERATRQLADACFAAWDRLITGSVPGLSRQANGVMDCSYVASTTARLIAHADEYQLHLVAMQIAVCRRVALRCVTVCERADAQGLASCARAAQVCANACGEVLRILWDGRLAGADGIGAALDDLDDASASGVG